MVLKLLILLFSFNLMASELEELKSLNTKFMNNQIDEASLLKGRKIINNISEVETDELEDAIILFEKNDILYQSQKKTLSYFFSLSYITWNTTPTLKRETQSDVDLFSEEKGPCLGAGLKYSNAYRGFESSLCYAFLDATISEDEDTGVQFNQNDVEVDAWFMQNNFFYKPNTDVALKVGVPLILRSADYGDVASAEVEDEKSFYYGLSFGRSISFSKMSFEMNFGSIESFQSSFWSLGLSYSL